MPPDFLRPECKKKNNFLEKLIRKKIKKKIIVNNIRIIRASYLRQVPGEHIFLPKKTGILPVKIRIFLYYKNKARGYVFKVKSISGQFR